MRGKPQLFSTGGLVSAPVTPLYDMDLASQLEIIDAIQTAKRNATSQLSYVEVQIGRHFENIGHEQRILAKRHH